MSDYHSPVLLEQSLEGLAVNPQGTYVDVTFGGGGHSRAILQALGAEGRLLAFDRDADALANTIDDPRFTLIHEDFRYMKNFLRLNGVSCVDGILADLGVSSHQFDQADRGFSTRFDAELDLRMDRRQTTTAKDIVNTASEEELRDILNNYGELPNAHRMARAIVSARAEAPILTTFDLKKALESNIPRNQENKFYAMVFQALRIEVNGELEALKAMLTQAVEMLNPGGRLVVISYHSLEDRLVKNIIKTGNFEGEVKKDFYGNLLSPLKPVTRKPIVADAEELMENPRSRSAKLRVAEKKQQ
ncbi:MAG: 16S rRNA (cytosine(1402)-N(4))-methyltransferase RsmH [Bacteroidales bacterium]|nr:16S rRNA (cytosine(1402)-N(4))-methyltransferase RsmH [Bacteroidales bacterium]MBP5241035.1 16S rRNA (cytosine(1402)-N(4))-methyltransferase RsmH [Bacteroidales bacterium]MBP5758996.1 16S rRNA (cytosine(1402)-N(4))-methyltransferase RsmH [Bacteroidales bacterium]